MCSTVQASGTAHFKAFPTCFFKLQDDLVCIEIDRSGKCEGQGRRRLSRHHRSQLVSLYIDMRTVDWVGAYQPSHHFLPDGNTDRSGGLSLLSPTLNSAPPGTVPYRTTDPWTLRFDRKSSRPLARSLGAGRRETPLPLPKVPETGFVPITRHHRNNFLNTLHPLTVSSTGQWRRRE